MRSSSATSGHCASYEATSEQGSYAHSHSGGGSSRRGHKPRRSQQADESDGDCYSSEYYAEDGAYEDVSVVPNALISEDPWKLMGELDSMLKRPPKL